MSMKEANIHIVKERLPTSLGCEVEHSLQCVEEKEKHPNCEGRNPPIKTR